jgi:hypothetical protein
VDIALWVAAGIVGAASLAASLNKLLVPREKLLSNPQMAWAEDFTQSQIRLIAVAELAGAIGVILPQATGVLPVLTPLAACGIIALQLGALRMHAKRHETMNIAINLFMIALAVFVAVGRFAGWGE